MAPVVGAADADVLLADFGILATFAGVSVTGILRESDEVSDTGTESVDATVRATTLQIRVSDWPAIGDGSTVTIGQRSFKVQGDALLQRNGLFKLLTLVDTSDVAASVAVTPATLAATEGDDPVQLTVEARNAAGGVIQDPAVTWRSGTPAVATVSGAGLVTIVGPGQATITATVDGVSDTCAVEVAPADPLMLDALEAAVAAQGHTLVGVWHGSQVVRTGTDVTSWPAARGGFELTAFGTTPPQFDAATETVSLDAAQQQAFGADSAVLAELGDEFAVVVVTTRPTNHAAEPYIAMLSQGAGAANLVLGLRKPLLDEIAAFATGVSGPLGMEDVTDQETRQAYHCARATIAGTDHTYVRRGRNPTVEHVAAGALATGAVTRFVLGADRDALPPTQRHLTATEIAAVLLVALAPGVGYADDLADLLNAWCEQHAGADPAPADRLGLGALDAALTAAGATLLPVWHASHATITSGTLTAWPSTDDAMTLAVFGDPTINAVSGAFGFGTGVGSAQGDSAVLNALTDGMAVVIVARVLGAGHLINVSAGTGSVALQVRSDDAATIGIAASGIGGLHVPVAMPVDGVPRAYHFARMRLGADQQLLLAIGRTAPTTETLAGAPLPPVVCSRLTLSGTRTSTPPGDPQISCADTAAIVPIALAADVDYAGAIQALLDTWAERYAGATP